MMTIAITHSFVAILSALLSTMPASRSYVGHDLCKRFDYSVPSWAEQAFTNLPSNGRLHLGNFPTPLYKLSRKDSTGEKMGRIMRRFAQLDISFYVKRDDMTGGIETGGNKIRKLEFLLADALAKGKISVVTIGGEQSNHCRATAGACRMVGLEPHLILRTNRADAIQTEEDDIGHTGNILFDRMVGSTIYCCTPGEYGRIGSDQLVSCLAEYLENNDSQSKGAVYRIPVGGSNGLGSFGYLNAVDELLAQWTEVDNPENPSLDHIVVACGSGGTACGISVGMALAHGAALGERVSSDKDSTVPTVHAVGVCDTPDYFYKFVAKIADEMGLIHASDVSTETVIRQHLIAHQGKGLGYALSTQEELDFVSDFAIETGIVLDPVYSGKALYHFFHTVMEENPDTYRGKNILFWHTGGALGLFEQGHSLRQTMSKIAPAKRLNVYGKGLEYGVDISKKKDSL
jgi:D-cysteine desulfhydrase